MGDIMTQEDFNKVETLTCTKNVWVNGVLKEDGDDVDVKGNDKIQLLASKKAVYKKDYKKVKKEEQKKTDPE